MSDEDKLRRLRELAVGATPGPWFPWDRNVGWHILVEDPATAPEPRLAAALLEGLRTDIGRGEDARYIAAVSPDVVTGLLDRLEQAEAAVDRAREIAPWVLESYRDRGYVHGRLLAALDGDA